MKTGLGGVPLIINLEMNKEFNYPVNPTFGTVIVPVLMSFEISRGERRPRRILVEGTRNLSLSPFCSSLHYGQAIFEGLKAFYLEDGNVGVFRMDKHAKRFAASAKKLAMCDFDEELFCECIRIYLEYARKFIPREEGHSLYLRPLLIANDPVIKVHASETYKFVLMSSIVGNYFSSGSKGSRVLVNKQFVRAFPGGTGDAKTAANYAMSLSSLEYAKKIGYEQVLYLDAAEHSYFEELGGMNFFLVKDGKLITPKLNGQILAGVTRESVISLARDLGMECEEARYSLNEFIEDHAAGRITEAFATGTAAVVNPLIEIGVQDTMDSEVKRFEFDQFEIASTLRNALENVQKGKSNRDGNWLEIIPAG